MLLSVCLIAKDEERFLAGCLESVLPVADEIVLVDTGSTDRTLEIAAEHGCRIVQRPWDDDFSAARNAGIDIARGRWILCMDADERLCHAEALPAALRAAPPEVGGFFIERHDLVTRPEEGEQDVYPIGILRAFRNHPEIRYEGIVHERPNETIPRAGFEVRSLATLKLIHLVSELPRERLVAKQEKYLQLLDRELGRTPATPGRATTGGRPCGSSSAGRRPRRSSGRSRRAPAHLSPCAPPRGACWRRS